MEKSLTIIISTFCIKVFAIDVGLGIDFSKHILFSVFIFAMFLPELGLLVSKGFRNWLQDGMEDGDGKLHKSDVANMLIHYSTLWCTRLYVLFGLLEAFYSIEVREVFVMGSLAGAFGIEAIGFLANKSKINLPK